VGIFCQIIFRITLLEYWDYIFGAIAGTNGFLIPWYPYFDEFLAFIL
jgi:hypothetical protein